MSECSAFILVNKNTFWDHKFLSDVTGCQTTQVLDCTSSTVLATDLNQISGHKNV